MFGKKYKISKLSFIIQEYDSGYIFVPYIPMTLGVDVSSDQAQDYTNISVISRYSTVTIPQEYYSNVLITT